MKDYKKAWEELKDRLEHSLKVLDHPGTNSELDGNLEAAATILYRMIADESSLPDLNCENCEASGCCRIYLPTKDLYCTAHKPKEMP